MWLDFKTKTKKQPSEEIQVSPCSSRHFTLSTVVFCFDCNHHFYWFEWNLARWHCCTKFSTRIQQGNKIKYKTRWSAEFNYYNQTFSGKLTCCQAPPSFFIHFLWSVTETLTNINIYRSWVLWNWLTISPKIGFIQSNVVASRCSTFYDWNVEMFIIYLNISPSAFSPVLNYVIK